MNHTKEPWKITNTGHGGIGVIEGDNHIFVAEVGGRTAQEIMANTNRIVACVNACAGITNEALEAGVIHSALINFEESLELQKGEQFCFYDITVLEDV